ncbi:MAG: hypothetical protein HY698_10310 [Deltaproteobacteria bacterium]|nr:hypothetical protein [Deltaproteobacteria bacterium]
MTPLMGATRKPGLAIFVLTVSVYFLFGSRERPWGDARLMYEVAERMVTRGAIDISTEWPPMSHKGADGKIYSQYSLGPSLVSIPGILLRNGVSALAPAAKEFTLILTSHIASALLGGLTCVLFFGMCRRLGASVRVAMISALVLGFSTAIFVYARYPFSEILQAACFTGFIAELQRVTEGPDRRRALALGAWGGALLHAKLIYALSLAGGGVFLMVALWRRREALLRVSAAAMVTFLPLLLLAALYNHARWGSPFSSGYEDTLRQMDERTWAGLWGLLFSPGKSLFLYSPPLVLGIFALPTLIRKRPLVAACLTLTVLPVVLFYSRFLSWSGDYCYGPRYLTAVVPVLLVPIAPWLESLAEQRNARRVAWLALGALAAAGLLVQALGNAFYWDHYIRIAMKARTEWLGQPNRAGAAVPERDRGHCDSCFEDMHGHQWLPAFSPIEGHAWLLRHVPFGHDWKEAEKDAPWRRYTTLELDIEEPYARARLDWWGLLWIGDYPRLWGIGVVLLVVMCASTLFGMTLFLGSVSNRSTTSSLGETAPRRQPG